ncbi:zinc ribbon domain-containing protein [Halorubellus salinus]|uniref:zinc ribbon domain-containing protein n=1 Tax=Halorubellus salinus TaxID=755309 RepID=UPI001D08E651|nr:zinc ribbon domain-containing protein [Halorubellus salinus]
MVERSSTRRPWLAALLGVVATGAGHLYLRRWLRALGWLALTTAVTVIYVPETALRTATTGNSVPIEPFLPSLTVIALSVADAYLIAKLTNRLHSSLGADESQPANKTPQDDYTTDPKPVDEPDDAVDCPHCGKPLDPDLEFCHWCTTDLADFDTHQTARGHDDV